MVSILKFIILSDRVVQPARGAAPLALSNLFSCTRSILGLLQDGKIDVSHLLFAGENLMKISGGMKSNMRTCSTVVGSQYRFRLILV